METVRAVGTRCVTPLFQLVWAFGVAYSLVSVAWIYATVIAFTIELDRIRIRAGEWEYTVYLIIPYACLFLFSMVDFSGSPTSERERPLLDSVPESDSRTSCRLPSRSATGRCILCVCLALSIFECVHMIRNTQDLISICPGSLVAYHDFPAFVWIVSTIAIATDGMSVNSRSPTISPMKSGASSKDEDPHDDGAIAVRIVSTRRVKCGFYSFIYAFVYTSVFVYTIIHSCYDIVQCTMRYERSGMTFDEYSAWLGVPSNASSIPSTFEPTGS